MFFLVKGVFFVLGVRMRDGEVDILKEIRQTKDDLCQFFVCQDGIEHYRDEIQRLGDKYCCFDDTPGEIELQLNGLRIHLCEMRDE